METIEHSFFDIPVKQTVLDNGLSVFTMDTKTKKTFVKLMFKTGSCRDGKFPGRAHFIEHLNMGTEKGEPIHPLIRPLVFKGAYKNASTGHVTTDYFINGTSEIALDAARTLVRLTFEGGFSPKHVESERQTMLSECRTKDAQEKYRTLSARVFYPHVPWRHNSPLGTVRSFENVTVENLSEFHRDYYTPDNAAIVAVGSVDHDVFVDAMARERFPERRCTAEPIPADSPRLIRSGIEDDIMTVGVAWLFRGTGDWRINRRIGMALDLMVDATVGTLFHRLRYRDRLVYDVSASVTARPQEISVSVPIRPVHFNYAEESFFEEAGRIARNDISQEAFDLLMLRKRQRFESQLETMGNADFANMTLVNWEIGDYEDERPYSLSMTREQLAEAAQQYLRRDAYGCLHVFRK